VRVNYNNSKVEQWREWAHFGHDLHLTPDWGQIDLITEGDKITIKMPSGTLVITGKFSWTPDGVTFSGEGSWNGAYNSLIALSQFFTDLKIPEFLEHVYDIESSWGLNDEEYKAFRRYLRCTCYGARLRTDYNYLNEDEVKINNQFIIAKSLAENAMSFNRLNDVNLLTPKKVAAFILSSI